MYLVELRPGKEELYRSVDELAAAIRRGDVDVHSRIFHRATSKWISITLHPQFKAIANATENEALPPSQKPWTFLTSAADGLEQDRIPDPMADSATESKAPPAESSAVPTTEEHPSGTWRRPFALGLAGLLVTLGAQIAFSVPRPHWSRLGHALASVTGGKYQSAGSAVRQPSSVVSLASNAGWGQVGYPLPEAVTKAKWSKTPIALPAAPAIRFKGLDDSLATAPFDAALSVETLIQGYDAAYDEARTRLESGIRVAQLQQLFAPSRLASATDVAQLRLNVSGAANFARAYRAREGEIERTHQDTFAVISRRLGWPPKQIRQWYARSSHKEPHALVALTEPLLASIDSILGVLAVNADIYHVVGDSITFNQPEAAAEYRRLRQQVEQQLASARAERSDRSPGVMAVLLDAIGTTRLPVESSSM